MFRVGLDVSALDLEFKSHALRGTGRYVNELVRYFDSLDPSGVDVLEFQRAKNGTLLNSLVSHMPLGRNTIRQQVLSPFQLGWEGGSHVRSADLLHFPAHIDAPSWNSKHYAVTVLDLIPIVLSDLYKAEKSNWRFQLARWLELKAIRGASLVFAISECTARDVNRILDIPRERIVVTHLGVDGQFLNSPGDVDPLQVRHELGLPMEGKIVLYVGGIDQRKNMAVLLEGFHHLRAMCAERLQQMPILVLAGKIDGDAEYPKLLELIEEFNLSDSVFMPGFVTDSELVSLYSISSVFFFPSLYEGFGLPPLEAMAAGAPVVCSNTSSLPEVMGDCGVLISPFDPVVAARELYEILRSPQRARELTEQGRQQAARFTWDKTGAATLRGYERIAKERDAV